MTGVRVLRLLEYQYASSDAADADMAHWNLGGQAVKDIGRGSFVRSTLLVEPFTTPLDVIEKRWLCIEPAHRALFGSLYHEHAGQPNQLFGGEPG